ncbi:MAG: hypothetical protein JW757_01930, partial [Anaerolineales bacterium]|nr:hypothetical protein [Anaerolineales bacterium]
AHHNEHVTRAILERCAGLAPLAVYVAQENITRWLQDAGYYQVEVYAVAKHRGLTRYIHRARSQHLPGSI